MNWNWQMCGVLYTWQYVSTCIGLPVVVIGDWSIISTTQSSLVHATAVTTRAWTCSSPVASLGSVTPGAATEGVTPLFFSWKTWRAFLVASSAVSPLVSSWQKLPFFAHRYHYRFLWLSLGCHPPLGCHLHLCLPVRPRFSIILCKCAHKFFSFGCHPLEGVTRSPGAVRSPRPLVTPLQFADNTMSSFCSECEPLCDQIDQQHSQTNNNC